MTAPLSPDEGVRAALEAAKAALIRIRECSSKGAMEGYGKPELWADDLFRSHGDVARALKQIDAALSTPVPEEGLPRGSASAAENIKRVAKALHESCCRQDVNGYLAAKIDCTALADVAIAALSTEAGAGVAAALPSPLPSQGEPVADDPLEAATAEFGSENDAAWNLIELAERCGAENCSSDDESGWSLGFEAVVALSKAVVPAEALAAERAKREYAEAARALTSGRLEAAEARADRAEEALKAAAAVISDLIFAAETTLACLNSWNGGRGCVADVEGIVLRARTILKETPHDER